MIRGDLRRINDLKARLRAMPITLAEKVAGRAAPAMTAKTQGAYNSGRTVYGTPRPAGVDGKPLTLRRTGAVADDLAFVVHGTIIRARLGPDYARYLIGRYDILPNGAMPVEWAVELRRLVADTRVVL